MSAYEIGPFLLDADAGIVTRGGTPVPLGGRSVAVLAALVARPNELVQKSRILDAAWPGVIVEENNLAAQISALRRVLAQADGGSGWIETLARRGYRFVGPVKKILEASPADVAHRRPRSNLPEPLTSFVGRERELVEIKRLLPTTRLLTLVGAGGTGKTRIAMQLGAEVLDAYHDGVWFVDLAPHTDGERVAHAVARVLNVHEEGNRPILESLCEYAKARQLLLIFDNCEHLLDASAVLATAMLGAAADTTIIATSREPLDVAGEQLYLLPTLSLPDANGSAEAIGCAEAVQLFVDRAQLQRHNFRLTGANATTVAQICTRLDGIPLALELAAARVRSLTIEEINTRLSDRFSLLTLGSRTALPRQQTLRGVLDWSYDLLTDEERVVLRRLAVFSGGFTLDAAASVGADQLIDGSTVMALVSQLVARSLVVPDSIDGNGRYRLLETTRAYALEKLSETHESHEIRRRHAGYLVDLFERAPAAWLRFPDADWHRTYLPELDNVRVALDWSFGDVEGDVAMGIALAGTSAALWPVLSLRREGVQRLEVAIGRIGSQTSQRDQARLWLWLGLVRAQAAPAQSADALERAATLYRQVNDACGLAYALLRLAGRLARVGQMEQAERLMAEAFPLLENAGSPKLLADYFSTHGFVKWIAGDLAPARTSYQRAVEQYRCAGSEEGALNVLGNLAELTWSLGDLDAALVSFQEIVRDMRRDSLRDRRLFGTRLVNLAALHTQRGEVDLALAAAREGLPLLGEAGCAWTMLDHVALWTALTGMPENAARVAGYSDASHAANKTSRQANEARARDRLQRMLEEQLAPDELDRMLLQGARLTDQQACRAALGE